MNDYLDEFGAILIKEVRDRTIRLFNKQLRGIMRDKNSQLLFEKMDKLSKEQQLFINEIVPRIVDLCLHNMLCMFEEHDEFQIIVDGENIADLSDGLSGELYTSDGWIDKFSEQR